MKRSKWWYFLFIIVLILGLNTIPSLGNSAETVTPPAPSDTIYLHIGSPLLLSQQKIEFLDPENFDITAMVKDKRTLLPLRSISEYFGADVSYDANEKSAMLKFNGKTYQFPIDKKYYFVIDGGEKKTIIMDTAAIIRNNRTMLPIRVIAENILGKTVDYYNSVIAISGKSIDLEHNATLVKDIKTKIGTAVKAQSLSELQLLLDKLLNNNDETLYRTSGSGSEIFVSENSAASSPQDAAGADSTSKGTYSSTNTQVLGIDEADIVKTDGDYLYIAGNNAVRIVKATNGKMNDSAIIKLADNKYVQEIYVDGDRLILLGNRMEESNYNYPVKDGLRIMSYPYYQSKTFSFADVYDISNPENPAFIKGHEMEGSYQTSRKSDQIVYMITNKWNYRDIILPMMKDTAVSDNSVSMKIDDIMIMPDYPVSEYVILSAIDIQNDEKTEVEAIAAAGNLTYMSENALYFAANDYNGMTAITKFKIDGMKIGYAGTGKISGNLLNQFSMDEFDGYLRVAATTQENGNAIYVLDDSLNTVGSVTGLAKGEQIYSVRFIGDKGYIVTYRTMDPLFVLDLSVPEAPKVTGELKIPGFSNYLHPVGENLILGIGMDTKEIYEKDSNGNEIVVGVRQNGLKIALFDVSDMGKPKEITNLVIGNQGSYSEALYNHKAVMIDPSKEQIVFDATITNDSVSWQSKQGALVISYKNKQLNLRGTLDYINPEVYGKYIPTGRRAAFIGNTLYYIQDGTISSYNYDTLNKIDMIILK